MSVPAFENWCRRALLLGMAAVVLGLCAAAPWTGLPAGYGEWLGAPDAVTIAGVVGFVALASLGGDRQRWVVRLAAAACLVLVWGTHRVLSMGDGHLWRQWTAEGCVCYAEPLSSLVHGYAYRLFGAPSVEWLSVVAGLAATWAWLHVTDRLSVSGGGHGKRFVRLLAASLWASSGVCVLFCQRYVEHTQLGIAPMLLGLGALLAWSRDLTNAADERPARPRQFAFGVAMLTVAALTHLQYVGLLAAALAAVFVLDASRLGRSCWLRCAGVALAVVVAVVVVGVGLLWLSPFVLIPGTVAGGADSSYWTPLVDEHGSWFGGNALLSRPHLVLVTHALLFAAPALPLVLAVVAWRARRPLAMPGASVVIASAFAFVVFVLLHGFDLGWPIDADLMLSMSPTLSLLAAVVVLPRAGRWPARVRPAAIALALLLTAATWCVIAPLSRPIWSDLSQRNSPLATLIVRAVGERGDADGPPPYRVRAAVGEVVEMRLRGPAGADFGVVKGVPDPACEGHPYGSVADIQVGNDLQASQFVAVGRFDERGEAVASWRVERLPGGEMPGVQMFVLRGSQHRWPVSAAFYFESP